METLRLAYRDVDRLPMVFAIRETAKRYYDLEVLVIRIHDEPAFEEALFDGSADVLIEHLEFLYEKAMQGEKITMFCAPSKGGGLHLVVPQHVRTVEDFRGKTIGVRTSGQPYAVTLWLRMLGLLNDVATVMVPDGEVGRWGQWKKVVNGECVATFMSPLYLPAALAAGLKVLPVPEIPIVGQFAQACLSRFSRGNPETMRRHLKAVVHALAWLTKRPADAYANLQPELAPLMNVGHEDELKRRFDAVVNGIKLKPYPTADAIANTFEIATMEYLGAQGLNPLSLWDLHWVKELDDEGFIDGLTI
jgi:ABC-type nitrate/sulfonate/bicarbonate transport system substrate-binding protein